jgi:ABC-type transport system involved in cytochrome c biogenesis ATPase subunit
MIVAQDGRSSILRMLEGLLRPLLGAVTATRFSFLTCAVPIRRESSKRRSPNLLANA